MKKYDIELSENYKFLKPCRLQCFLHEEGKRASILVFPGGGYYMVSDREAQPVALKFFEKGYNAFVLTYSTADRTPDVHYPMQLLQAEAAILAIRANKKEWNCTDDVITCGFSAGGHLAGMTAVYYDRDCVLNAFKVTSEKSRPSAVILCYPVISSVANPHIDSFINLTGSKNPKDFINISIEYGVDKNTPPVFIWHTANDGCVNINNTLVLAKELAKNNIPFETHIFEDGAHGLSLCDKTTNESYEYFIKPDVAIWFDLCITWLKKRF